MSKKELLFLILILGIGIFFRFYLIKVMPGGLFPDEAANGLDINNILKGHLEPFFARGNGREGLFFYLLALAVKLWGRGFWQHHVISAAVGSISLLAVYLLTKRLYETKTALIATFLMAVGTWHIVLSRTAFRANLIPLFTTFTLYFYARMIQAKTDKEKYWSAAFAGIFFAGGMYTYIAYRMMIPILGTILFLLLLIDWRQKFVWVKQYWKAFATSVVTGFITFIPLLYYFITHPGSFVGRSSQVSVFNVDLNQGHLFATIWDVFRKSLEAFFVNGDLNWRHNISGEPFLSPLVSPFFGIALVVMTWLSIKFIVKAFKNKQDAINLNHLVLIGLFWGMLVPVVTTAEGIPHGLRSIGVIPAVYIISAVGLVYFAKMILKVWHYEWMEKLYAVVAILYFLTMGYVSYTKYFVFAYNDPINYQAFRSDLSTVSDYLNSNPDKEKNYLVLDLFSLQTVEYFTTTTNNPYVVVDPANAYKLNLSKGDRVIFTNTSVFDFIKYDMEKKNYIITEVARDRLGSQVPDMLVIEATLDDKSRSLSFNEDKTFSVLNFGDRVDWSWQNQSFDPWVIKIYRCSDISCEDKVVLKENNQNDYLSNHDYMIMDGTKSDLFFQATAYDLNGSVIKDFGIVKSQRYLR